MTLELATYVSDGKYRLIAVLHVVVSHCSELHADHRAIKQRLRNGQLTIHQKLDIENTCLEETGVLVRFDVRVIVEALCKFLLRNGGAMVLDCCLPG